VTGALYIASAVAVISTLLMVTRPNVVHALLYLIVSLLATAVMFLTLGAPFLAAFEVIVYAGAIMVLFVFVVMMLDLGPKGDTAPSSAGAWAGPAVLSTVLGIELLYVLSSGAVTSARIAVSGPAEVAASLFTTYLLGVEVASLLLLAGLVGAHHLGRRDEDGE
jgi:NADH-quinone oxidoreductase subunit J